MNKTIFSSVAIVLALFVHADAAAQPLPQPASLFEIGVADSLYSEILGEQRQIWIHLPNGGDLQEGHRYPVVYLLDGGVHLGGLGILQQYYVPAILPEMIVVGISNRTHRTRDLTTSEVETRQGLSVAGSGGAETFTRFLAQELIPYIDEAYPTSTYRTLIGHSYGGLFTVNTLVHHRDLFENYIAIDPSLDWDDQKLLRAAAAELSEGGFEGKGLFVSLANELPRFTETLTIDDVMQDTTEFSLSMRSILEFVQIAEGWQGTGLRFAWRYYEHDFHWTVPLISMRDGLTFLFEWWELRSPSRYNIPETPTEALVALVRERAERLTRHLGYPTAMEEEVLNMLGYMSMERDQNEKAKTMFELALEYYPESANAHASMADFYASQQDSARALVHARKAFSISGSTVHQERVAALKGGPE